MGDAANSSLSPSGRSKRKDRDDDRPSKGKKDDDAHDENHGGRRNSDSR